MKALITGASFGLGKEFALWLSAHGYEVVLVARNEIALKEVQALLSTKSEIIVADLTKSTDIEKVCQYLANEKIDFLINNAGVGSYGYFWEIPSTQENKMYILNMIAPALLMKHYIAFQPTGRILNISSIAAKQVDPLMAGYGASKRFLLELTRSIQVELKHSSKHFALHICLPGPFQSNFNKTMDLEDSKVKINSKKIVEITMNYVFKNKFMIIPGTMNKLAFRLSAFLPRVLIDKIEYSIQKSKKNKIL